MTTVFWDSYGAIFVDYPKKGKTINGEYCARLLQRLDQESKNKCPHLAKKKILFYQGNALAHRSAITMAKLHELKYEIFPHGSYFTDLAPCDFFLFLNFRKWFEGKKFSWNVEVITTANDYFSSLDKSYYFERMKDVKKRWTKCIKLKGEYVEE